MTTDNRTNEPTEAQVEAAEREWYEQANGYETWASASGKHQQVVKVRAARALVAATSVPVQGEPNDDRTPAASSHSKVLDHLQQEHAESPEEVAGFYVEWEDASGVWHRLPDESVGKETIKIGERSDDY